MPRSDSSLSHIERLLALVLFENRPSMSGPDLVDRMSLRGVAVTLKFRADLPEPIRYHCDPLRKQAQAVAEISHVGTP